MRRILVFLALCCALILPRWSAAVPVTITGGVINPGDADYATLTGVLGVSSGAPSLIAFDLATLGFDPLGFLAIDDAIPAADSDSGLAGSGIDLDAVAGISSSSMPIYAASVFSFAPGQRISAPAGSLATNIEPLISDPGYTNKTTAMPGGTGGPGFLLGTPDDALGSSDSVNPLPGGALLPEFGFLSIGSGGLISLLFAEPVNRNGNIGGTAYDLVYYDFGGAGDSGFFQVDVHGIPVPEPGVLSLLAMRLLFFDLRRRRRAGAEAGRAGERAEAPHAA
jgi:hypothetical protein